MTTELKNGVENFLSNFHPPASGMTYSQEQINAHYQRIEQEDKRREAEQILANAGIPLRNREAIVSENPKWNKIEERLNARLGSGFIVAIVGPRGTGKTQLGCGLCRSAAQAGRKCLYASAMGFFLDIKESFNDKTSEKDVIERYAKPAVLVLDETQERGQTAWEDRLLTHLIDRRYGAKKDTLLLSNQTETEFLLSIGESIASRLRETGGIAVADWESFRRR
jgi:DNA replication protein DnaC